MPIADQVVQTSPGAVVEVTIGGVGRRALTVGGAAALPFLRFEGAIPHRPAIAVDVQDSPPDDWAATVRGTWGEAARDPAAWARAAADAGADLVALTLASTNPDGENASAASAVATVRRVLEATDLPLVVYGPGVAAKDNEVLVAVAEAASGQRLALGMCEDKNYRTIVAACLAHGHVAVARSPIDLNLAKQLNILIADMGLPVERILMDPTTGALGYGLEYTYSVMERLRLAALQGDKWCALPMICTVGYEAWRQKEAKATAGVPTEWGDLSRRGVLWEATTAQALLEAGADILVMRHPQAISLVRGAIDKLMG
jgi:acetyl-CoA decarbonylase/synthase, CODH/ACS complex subunit delta